jgi:hypothetical protein
MLLLIQCGNINCGNAGENEVRARVFKTRTNEHSSPEGWTIEQFMMNITPPAGFAEPTIEGDGTSGSQ